MRRHTLLALSLVACAARSAAAQTGSTPADSHAEAVDKIFSQWARPD